MDLSCPKQYQCSQCSKHFKNKKYLNKHLAVHTDIKPHECLNCGERFKLKRYLSRHSAIHSEERPYRCTQCDKQFRKKFHLNNHLLVHTKEKLHQCTICGKHFNSKYQLNAHLLVHSDVKPYQCTKCDKSFRRKIQLVNHFWVHSGEKPHQCTECGKRYVQKSSLNKHLSVHFNEKLHQCTKCDKRYYMKYDLIRHSQLHSNKNYQCPECSKQFMLKTSFMKHMSIHYQHLVEPENNIQFQSYNVHGLTYLNDVIEERQGNYNSCKDGQIYYETANDHFQAYYMDLEKLDLKNQELYIPKSYDFLQYDKFDKDKKSEEMKEHYNERFIVEQNVIDLSKKTKELSLCHKTLVQQKSTYSESALNLSMSQINNSITDQFYYKKNVFQVNGPNDKLILKQTGEKEVSEHLQIELQNPIEKTNLELAAGNNTIYKDVKYENAFPDKGDSFQYILSNANVESCPCFLCNKKFRNESVLYQHILNHINVDTKHTNCSNCYPNMRSSIETNDQNDISTTSEINRRVVHFHEM